MKGYLWTVHVLELLFAQGIHVQQYKESKIWINRKYNQRNIGLLKISSPFCNTIIYEGKPNFLQ